MGLLAKPAVIVGRSLLFFLPLFGQNWASGQQAAPGDQPGDGLFVTVPNPIDDRAVSQIQHKVQDAIERQNRNIRKVVFDFNPQGLPSGTSDWNSPNQLAEYIRDLRQGTVGGKNYAAIGTFAFVRNQVSKHTVLPVLACKHIIMSNDKDPSTREIKARLGDVRRDASGTLSAITRQAYKEYAQSFASPDLIQRMLDRGLPLKRVKTTDGAVLYVNMSDKSWSPLERSRFVVVEDLPDGLRGDGASFDAQQAREMGLCEGIQNTPQDVADSLRLPTKSLKEDWLVGQEKYPWRIEVRGPLDKGKLEAIERRIKQAIGRGANYLILQLDAEEGETKHVAAAAQRLRNLRDDNNLPLKTVAYVPPGRSLGAATFLALACYELVMAPDAVLADFNYLPADQVDDVKAMLLALVKDQGYPPLLFEAALTKDMVLYHVKTKEGQDRLVTQAEVKDLPWHSRIEAPKGQLLKINATLARTFHVAQASDIDSLSALYTYCRVDPQKVRIARDDWLEQVAEFFRQPVVNFLLIMLGIVGLIMELKMPGTTVPGVLAAICFVLFFWAYSFVGQFTLLAVLLFILGLVLIGLEIFVLPGFGFTGIAGIVLLISSLVLVTLEHMPQTSQDWANLGATFGTFGFSLVAALVAAFVLAWYLPSIPYANRLVLQPPGEDGPEGRQDTHASVVNPALLGAMGVAATPLRPAGKAQIGDDFLDVVAEGDYVEPGKRVQIIEIEGNRIVVKEI
jgi:membrane-bound ClpP family serine protease